MANTPKPNNSNKNNQKGPNIKGPQKTNWITVLIFAIIAFMFISMMMRLGDSNGQQTDDLVASEFMQAVDQGRIKTAVYDTGSETITGTYYPALTAGESALSGFNEGFNALNAQLGAMSNAGGRLGTVEV